MILVPKNPVLFVNPLPPKVVRLPATSFVVAAPDTPYKIYVHADEHVRAARRSDMGEIDSVAQRDAADSKRATAPLMIASGATVLDNSHHSIESSVTAALAILKQQGLPL